jgi:transcriptional regulator with XRE-family HTH domain
VTGLDFLPALPFCKLTFQAKKPDFRPYPNELKTIGDHLKKRRLDLKMLQKEIAERFGTTVCTVRNWEKNRSSPSLPFITKIIQFLGYVPYNISELNFGKEIAIKRGLLGLSQKNLAYKIGVDPCTVRSWEKGRHMPSKIFMVRLKAFFSRQNLH